ncbi:uncharacterized protein EAF01_006914 [Botrytis porri]|uniref:uncharacterized protein n=1 Tax=Botrytis porri TaxID=87229 RepID=UPI001900A608|nr:uncharacterized protein EAF01_006914 [Botrytis porri]KAF7901615.1 hypothetical protein EAF01_006914 [Botrytis porri]
MQLRESGSLGEIPSPLSTASQLDQKVDPDFSSGSPINSDIFRSERYKFMCGHSVHNSESNQIEKFNIFVETVNSIPQPHYRTNVACYVCDDINIFQENSDYDTRSNILNKKYRGKEYWIEGSIYNEPQRLKVTQTRWIESVLDTAREGCCLCILVVQAIAALGKGHFQGSPFSVCLQVKDIGGIKRYSIRQSEFAQPFVIELYRHPFEIILCTLRSRISVNSPYAGLHELQPLVTCFGLWVAFHYHSSPLHMKFRTPWLNPYKKRKAGLKTVKSIENEI